MISRKELDEKLALIDKDMKILDNNLNGDLRVRLDNRKKELNNSGKDARRVSILKNDIIMCENDINENNTYINNLGSEKKTKLVKDALQDALMEVSKAKDEVSKRISMYEKKFLKLKNDMQKSNEDNAIKLSNEIADLCYELKSNKLDLSMIENSYLVIEKSLESDDFNELLSSYYNIEKNIALPKINPVLNEKTEQANPIKPDEPTKPSEQTKPNSSDDSEEELIEKIENSLNKAEQNYDMAELEIAKDMINKLTDKNNRNKFLRRANICEFQILVVKNCEKLNKGEDVSYEVIEKAINIFKNFNDKDKQSYSRALDSLITLYNCKVKYDYQQDVFSNEKPKKYSFLAWISELNPIAWAMNKLRYSKFRKLYDKMLKRAEKKSNQKKINKVNEKIGNTCVVNGFRLFKARNKIASLKPKLYRNDFEMKESKKARAIKKYNDAVDFVTDEMSTKLDDFSNKECNIDNSFAMKNIIMQYIDTVSISNNYDELANKAIDVINNSRASGAITGAEWIAYMQEVNTIKLYRERYEMPYAPDENEIDDMVNYYDSDATCDEIAYVKRKENN